MQTHTPQNTTPTDRQSFFGRLSVLAKINITVAFIFITVISTVTFFTAQREKARILALAENQANEMTTMYFDSLNTMMLTGTMSQRNILREKMLRRPNVTEARVIRGQPVKGQFGQGYMEEQAVDELDLRALRGEQIKEVSKGEKGRLLTVIIPFRATPDTRGVNCLQCHQVPQDSINGAIRITYSISEMDADINAGLWKDAAANLVLMMLGLVLVNYLLKGWITRPLNNLMNERARAMAELEEKVDAILSVVRQAAEGDLTGNIGIKGDDAVAHLAEGVQRMVHGLGALVNQVQQSGIQVTSSATEIAATAKQQEATATEQAATVTEIAAAATEISATSRELVNTMDEVSEVAEGTAASAEHGQAGLEKMEVTMHRIAEASKSITSKLEILSEKAGNIGTVITTITKVADQTNLLSLNAAIEAEKAGEYGLGFSVVATEIRRLADQTAVASWDIEKMVKEMQSAVTAGVMSVEKFSEEVKRSVTEVEGVSAQLAKIIEQVRAMTPRYELVHEGMQSQALGAEQIKQAIIQLNESTQQTVESLRQSTSAIDRLNDAAHGLQNGVSRFKVVKKDRGGGYLAATA